MPTPTTPTTTPNAAATAERATPTTTMANSNKNPLLIVDVLENLFPYLHVHNSLASSRQVSKSWHRESSLSIKQNLRWRIGPFKDSQNTFLQVMASTTAAERARTFRNFNLYHSKEVGKGKGTTNIVSNRQSVKFLREFGPYIVDLQLKSTEIAFVKQHLKPEFLVNLERLELYDLSQAVLMDNKLLEDCAPFEKLKTLSFAHDGGVSGRGPLNEGGARACFNILKASPALKELEINLKKTTLQILGSNDLPGLNLTNLTSFKSKLKDAEDNLPGSTFVVLRPADFANLKVKCPNLKVLATNFATYCTCYQCALTLKEEICEMLSKYADQLEELHFSIVKFEAENDDENDRNERNNALLARMARKRPRLDSPAGAKPNCKIPVVSFPDFPLLQKLTMLAWFNTDLDALGSMPALQVVDIRMMRGVQFEPRHESHGSYPAVSYLKFRGRETGNVYIGTCPLLEASHVLSLTATFPNVTELDVELGDDEALRTLIITLGPTLLRLHLNGSDISDDGITGIEWTAETQELFRQNLSKEIIISEFRKYPCIGDFKVLRELTFTGFNLTSLSVEFGIIYVAKLTSLKLPPFKRYSQRPFVFFEKFKFQRTLVSVRPLVDNLKYLRKLDVNEDLYQGNAKDEKWRRNFKEDRYEFPANYYEYTGCGISSEDLAYIKERAPTVEIVYRELKCRRRNCQITNTE